MGTAELVGAMRVGAAPLAGPVTVEGTAAAAAGEDLPTMLTKRVGAAVVGPVAGEGDTAAGEAPPPVLDRGIAAPVEALAAAASISGVLALRVTLRVSTDSNT